MSKKKLKIKKGKLVKPKPETATKKVSEKKVGKEEAEVAEPQPEVESHSDNHALKDD